MKNAIGILLIVCAISNSMAVRLTKDEVKQGLRKVNDLRRKHADAYEIPNMKELNYDRKLEDLAVNRGCEGMNMIGDEGITFSIVPIPPMDQWASMNTLEKEKENFYDLLHPWTDRIGCSIMKDCHVDGKTYDGVCLVEPKHDPSEKGGVDKTTTGAASRQWSLACMILAILYFMF